jgi:hypothetical protein
MFKIAEPGSVDKKTQVFDVRFMPSGDIDAKTLYQQQFSYNNDYFSNARFALPVDDSHSMQLPQIGVEFEKKLIPLDAVAPEKMSLARYRNDQKDYPDNLKRASDAQLENLAQIDYEPQIQSDTLSADTDKKRVLGFTIKGALQPVDNNQFDDVRGMIVSQPCIIRFSVDLFGTVRHGIVEQSSGNTAIDSKLLTILRQCRFALQGDNQPVMQDSIPHYTSWGKIIFYNQ